MKRSLLSGLSRYVLALCLLLVLWQIASVFCTNEIIPDPVDTLKRFILLQGDTLYLSHLLISSTRLSSALLLGTVIAYPLGLLLGLSKKADALGAPLLFITYPFPKIVLLPVFFLLLGLGDSSRIALIALSSGYQILLLMRAKTKALDPVYLKVMRSMGARRFDMWRYVLWPATLPDLLTAVRIASGTAVAVLFLAESFATDCGLGFLIMDAWGMGDNETMFCAILGISFLGLGFYTLLWYAEKIFCPWFLAKH